MAAERKKLNPGSGSSGASQATSHVIDLQQFTESFSSYFFRICCIATYLSFQHARSTSNQWANRWNNGILAWQRNDTWWFQVKEWSYHVAWPALASHRFFGIKAPQFWLAQAQLILHALPQAPALLIRLHFSLVPSLDNICLLYSLSVSHLRSRPRCQTLAYKLFKQRSYTNFVFKQVFHSKTLVEWCNFICFKKMEVKKKKTNNQNLGCQLLSLFNKSENLGSFILSTNRKLTWSTSWTFMCFFLTKNWSIWIRYIFQMANSLFNWDSSVLAKTPAIWNLNYIWTLDGWMLSQVTILRWNMSLTMGW